MHFPNGNCPYCDLESSAAVIGSGNAAGCVSSTRTECAFASLIAEVDLSDADGTPNPKQ